MADWTDPGFEAVAHFITSHSGIDFPAARRRAAEEAFRRLMRLTRSYDSRDFCMRIQRESPLRDELIADLTVGETYFFREPEQFDFIRGEALPRLVSSAAGRPMRMWSAGCAAGEEPYSLAIVLAELGLVGRAAVLGSDISRRRLEQARRARYTDWSLRAVPSAVIGRWFVRHRDVGELSARIRQAVAFRYLNLAADPYPTLATGFGDLDLILCRNVLIYFDEATIRHVASRLIHSLQPSGWLFLGASDPPLDNFVRCQVIATGAGLAYHRPQPVKISRAAVRHRGGAAPTGHG